MSNLSRSRNVEVEITWFHAPLEDHASHLLECISNGSLSPIVNQVIGMPLVQITLDRVETVPRIVRDFTIAVAGRPTGELTSQPPAPAALNGYSLPPFTPEKLVGLYDFCASNERVISVEKTLVSRVPCSYCTYSSIVCMCSIFSLIFSSKYGIGIAKKEDILTG